MEATNDMAVEGASCGLPGGNKRPGAFPDPLEDLSGAGESESLVLGGGCFWCTEAVFTALDGVLGVTSGYCGGNASTANYEAVCSGRTDHAEVIRVDYDPRRISYGRLLKVFFSVAHDPTQLNRQGNDKGRQYRSVIFYGSEAERAIAAKYIAQLEAAKVFENKIVTELAQLGPFYRAEGYHQKYAETNPHQPYIQHVSMPKVEKLRKAYGEYLRS